MKQLTTASIYLDIIITMDFSDGRRWFVIGVENTTESKEDIESAHNTDLEGSIFFHLHPDCVKRGMSTNVTDIFEISESSKVIRRKHS